MSTTPSKSLTLSDDDLEEINRLWTVARVYSNTAHDINNALQVISGSAELLETAANPVAVLEKRVTAIRTQSGRAAGVIETLLLYSKGAPEPPRRLDLAALAAQAVAMRDVTLRRAGITATVSRSDEHPFWVLVSRWKLLQVLLNVLLVAEHAFAGAGSATIVVRLERPSSTSGRPAEEAEEMTLTVTGTGASFQDALSGARPPAPPLAYDVTLGCALKVARRIAAAQGGRLDAPTEVDPGAPVRLSLPLVRDV